MMVVVESCLFELLAEVVDRRWQPYLHPDFWLLVQYLVDNYRQIDHPVLQSYNQCHPAFVGASPESSEVEIEEVVRWILVGRAYHLTLVA